MGKSKIEYFGEVLIDLTGDSVSPSTLLKGTTAHDKSGNPILVGCVVIWRVNECNKALFDVENYRSFITNQCENAVRHVGCIFPYDKVGDDDVCLRSGIYEKMS